MLFGVLIGIFILSSAGYAQTIKSLEVDFKRILKDNESTRISRGTIFFADPDNLTLKVREPIEQWMIFEGYRIRLYYPEEKRALEISSQMPSNLPFFDAFVGMVKEDYGLTEIGYSIDRHELTNDTLYIYWNPPEAAAGQLGQYVLALVDNKIAYAEARDAENKVIAKSLYNDHIEHNGTYFPLTIKTTRYESSDSTLETIYYTNPQFNRGLSEEALNIKIPTDVEVEKLEW
jgi:outer membrane lipoprotein-sorting protein